MSLRHVVLLRFHEGTTPARVDAIAEALRALPSEIAVLRDYRVGADLGLADGNWDLGVVADVADEADYVTYRDHPAHQQVIAEQIRPVLADRAAIQYAT